MQLNDHTVLFNPLLRPLSSATTLGHSGPGSDRTEGALHISQSSNFIEASPSDSLMSYPGH